MVTHAPLELTTLSYPEYRDPGRFCSGRLAALAYAYAYPQHSKMTTLSYRQPWAKHPPPRHHNPTSLHGPKESTEGGRQEKEEKLSSPQALSALPNAQIFHTFSALASLQINCNFLPWKMYWNSFLTITNTSNSAANKNSKKKILSALHGRGYVANMTFLLICSVGMSRANISYLKLNMTFDI